jgi:tetratricopeptide (TPR) repeat protein
MSCCGKTICKGCGAFHIISNIHDEVKRFTCVFCRTLTSDREEYEKREKERIEANDPEVLRYRGSESYEAGDFDKAFDYYTKAAELGNAEAHYRLGRMYGEGVGIEKDKEKAAYHCEKASIVGHPHARFMLAVYESEDGRLDRAVKHWIIAANLGCEYSMKQLLRMYKDGYITKEDYGSTLRTHQAAIDATKSSQRDVAERMDSKNN